MLKIKEYCYVIINSKNSDVDASAGTFRRSAHIADRGAFLRNWDAAPGLVVAPGIEQTLRKDNLAVIVWSSYLEILLTT